MTIFLGMSEKKQTTEHLTETYKSNTTNVTHKKTWGKKKQPKTQFCSSCTKMLAGEESIFYLLFIPCNMWEKERPISSACVIFCYFETTKEGARKEKRQKKDGNRHTFIPISDMKS